MGNIRLHILLETSYAEHLVEEFKLVLETNGFDDQHRLNMMRLYSVDEHEISVRVPLKNNKFEEYSLTWQKHLANLATLNIYRHS